MGVIHNMHMYILSVSVDSTGVVTSSNSSKLIVSADIIKNGTVCSFVDFENFGGLRVLS